MDRTRHRPSPISKSATSPSASATSPPSATSRSTSPRASSSASSGRRAAARPPCCAPSPGSIRRPPARSARRGATSRRLPPAAARLRHRLPVLCAVSQPHRRRQCRLRPGQPAPGARPRSTTRVDELLALVGLPEPGRNIPPSSRAASSSAWRWPARWRPRPGLLLLDEPLSALDARVRAAPARTRSGAAAPARRHHHHGDARPGGGADHGRPHRGDEPGRDRAGRHAAGDLPPAGHGLRRRLRRHDELPARHARRRPTGSRSAALTFDCPAQDGLAPGSRSRSASGPRTCACATCRPTSPIACRSRSPSSTSSAPSAAPRCRCAAAPDVTMTADFSSNLIRDLGVELRQPARRRPAARPAAGVRRVSLAAPAPRAGAARPACRATTC